MEVVPDNDVSFLANILNQTMVHPLHWHHVNTCCHVICPYHAYVTIRRTLASICKQGVSTTFGAENKQEAAEFYSQHLPMHSCDVIWEIKSKSTFPMSFSLTIAEMNLVGDYRMLRVPSIAYLFLNESSDWVLTTSSSELFQRLSTLWWKVFFDVTSIRIGISGALVYTILSHVPLN